ncbi:zinc finger protein 2 homolog [Myripristis murdjan]|uniref:zinc finger protein 2 homolog n=1 Tax=Myripristis murdjan TaxID=586833 RepID=UPI001175F88F|nr:zinc finger protein 2 homolog [Myripristis murdjan]
MSNPAEMSTVQTLRTFVNQRLTAAVEEILGVFEKTIVVYEEEIERQRRLLDIVLKPEIKLHRADPPQPSVCKEELLLDQRHCSKESDSSLGQEPPQIKEEQEELCISQEGEQPLVQEEDVLKLTPTSEGSDHQSLHSDLYQTSSAAEEEPVGNVSFKPTQSEADGEACGVSEANGDSQLCSHNHHADESEAYKTSSSGSEGSSQSPDPKQQDRAHKCDCCSKEFSDMKKLKTHLRTHTDKRLFRCDTCGKAYIYMCYLRNHMRTHTGEKPFKCDFCGKGFSCHSNRSKHVKIHTDPPQPPGCKEDLLLDQQHCSKETDSSLGQEVPEPPQIKEEEEELCSSQDGELPLVQEEEEEDAFKLTPTSEGSDHQCLHSDLYQTQSAAEEEPVANISFKLTQSEAESESSGVSEPNSDSQLCSHNHHVDESEDYKMSGSVSAGSTHGTDPKQQNRANRCDRCSKEFSDMKKLKTHLRTHSGKQTFRCGTCGKAFNRMCYLKTHMRAHTGEKPFSCKTCGKEFSCQSNLTKHVRIHTGQKPYSCVHCGKEFSDGTYYNTHLRVHTGEKPYECLFCGKEFAVSSTLKRHTRIHTGEKPFKCGTCGKAFIEHISLKRHMMVHTGERPYRCNTCGKGFIRRSKLKTHMTSHAEVQS